MSNLTLTILMPCLNEAETLEICIKKARKWIALSKIDCEILIADNGSTDGSQEIARAMGARVVDVPYKGYGSALYYGAKVARGKYIIMGDSDDSYDFSNLSQFLLKLESGCDLVMGNRFAGGIDEGAMPWKNKYIGNPILTWVGKLLFHSKANDFHCGLRGFTKKAFELMDLRTTGMEFASEMVIKATLFNMKIDEVPTRLKKDGRSRPPHLKPWRDGWRHLRFMLLFSPRWLFLFPGLMIFLVSIIFYIKLLMSDLHIGSITLSFNTLFYAQAGIMVGLTAIYFGIATRLFATREELLPQNKMTKILMRYPILEMGCILSVITIVSGFALGLRLITNWERFNYGVLNTVDWLHSVSISTLLITAGCASLFFSLVIGVFSLPIRR